MPDKADAEYNGNDFLSEEAVDLVNNIIDKTAVVDAEQNILTKLYKENKIWQQNSSK